MNNPACNLQLQKLPGSSAEAEYRSEAKRTERNATTGMSSRYDVFGGNMRKRNALGPNSKIFSKDRPNVKLFFECLKASNAKRPDTDPWETAERPDTDPWETTTSD